MREHSVCTNSVSNLQHSSCWCAHPSFSKFLCPFTYLLFTGTVPPALSADSQETRSICDGGLEPSLRLGIAGRCDVGSSCHGSREHSVCTASVTKSQQPHVVAYEHVGSAADLINHVASAGRREFGQPAVLPVFSEEPRLFGRSMMESAGGAEHQVGLRLGEHRHSLSLLCRWIRLVGFFFFKKNCWKTNGLKHEIVETREAGKYKFCDGGTLVSSIRVTAPVSVAGQKGENSSLSWFLRNTCP